VFGVPPENVILLKVKVMKDFEQKHLLQIIKRKKQSIAWGFNPFLLGMLKISIYCAVKAKAAISEEL